MAMSSAGTDPGDQDAGPVDDRNIQAEGDAGHEAAQDRAQDADHHVAHEQPATPMA